LLEGDFFALAAADSFDPDQPVRRYDAVLLDVDHSPRHVLHPSHAPFYTADGLRALRRLLVDDGVFALWSDDPPDDELLPVLREVWADVEAHVVEFANPLTRGTSANTVYVARS
jgi:spermidine synthase